jgi:pyruvate/2-oxoglutarate dehydrogenase complex dihydrolipoamide dehydrogenase (E3) component
LLVFAKPDGRLLGAQAVGTEGVDKRIDVVATMIQMGGTVADLAEVTRPTSQCARHIW